MTNFSFKQLSSKAKVKATSVVSLLSVALLNAQIAFAADDPTTKITTGLEGVQDFMSKIALVCGVTGIMAAGIVYMAGDKFSQKAIAWITNIAIGLVVVAGAAAIGSWFWGLWA